MHAGDFRPSALGLGAAAWLLGGGRAGRSKAAQLSLGRLAPELLLEVGEGVIFRQKMNGRIDVLVLGPVLSAVGEACVVVFP